MFLKCVYVFKALCNPVIKDLHFMTFYLLKFIIIILEESLHLVVEQKDNIVAIHHEEKRRVRQSAIKNHV